MISGLLGVVTLRRVCLGLILRLEVPLRLAALPFLVEVCYVLVAGRRLGGRAVGRSGASRPKRVSHSDVVDVGSAQCFVNSSLAPGLL